MVGLFIEIMRIAMVTHCLGGVKTAAGDLHSAACIQPERVVPPRCSRQQTAIADHHSDFSSLQ